MANAQSVISSPATISEDNTKLLLADRILLDNSKDGFMSVSKTVYAPDGKRFAVVACGGDSGGSSSSSDSGGSESNGTTAATSSDASTSANASSTSDTAPTTSGEHLRQMFTATQNG